MLRSEPRTWRLQVTADRIETKDSSKKKKGGGGAAAAVDEEDD